MEIRYQREMKHNYLIIRPDRQDQDFYEAHMMVSNVIEGLLKFHIKYAEEEKLYYYEITSRQPLNRLLENRGMKAGEIRKLISGISAVLEKMEQYLLREEGILLEADYIYIETDTYQVYLCFIPGRQGNFPEDMKKLLQYLLGKIDHRDKEGVVLAYGLFQESQKDNYGMKDLLKVLFGGESCIRRPEKAEERENRGCAVFCEEIKGQGIDAQRKKGIEKKDFTDEKEDSMEKDKKGQVDHGRNWEVWLSGLFVLLVCLMAGGWFIMGENWIRSYGIKIAAAVAAGAAVISQILSGIGKRQEGQGREAEKTDKKADDFWIMELEEEEAVEKEPVESLGANDTALLADLGDKRECRRLISMESGGDVVRIAYFPFLIGKQEGLVDFVMNRETVSRLHLRIDEDEDGYRITDLNSTNGTTVNGRMLEANESADLSPGDEIYIADKGFLFK
ncbi:DUF6382 domain-containing protein [Clostridium sp. AM58-1XD]|uniref:DUF6382 domain-containing protein n=1 Tax=Clostridium sp. AM58-1XD TaxID=2292307 RepID=UPI000E4A652E|nr:DUF6382 domain-containing protein [Clostridium sp. AM58-1XD]RGY97352.1 FHA domain-containing protein [Clostridium sp. AM58-1XD]